jgi:hypothetical protein
MFTHSICYLAFQFVHLFVLGVAHRNASFTRFIAGCTGFFTFTQFGDVPAR